MILWSRHAFATLLSSSSGTPQYTVRRYLRQQKAERIILSINAKEKDNIYCPSPAISVLLPM